MELSIVIPVWNEAGKLRADVAAARAFLSAEGIDGEVIVVDDGSDDGTADQASDASQVIRYDPHVGKGRAVRTGVAAAGGQYVLVADSGSPVPFDNALLGLEMIRNGRCDIAHASRRLTGSVVRGRTWRRRAISTVFRRLVGLLAPVPPHLTDTQCGFKLYRGDIARDLHGRARSDGFMLDIEIILLATKAAHTIAEFPVEWTCDADSRLRLFGHVRQSWRELRAARERAR